MSNEITLVNDKQTLKGFLEDGQFTEALRAVASKYLSPERAAKVALLAASREPKLYLCTKGSFLQAIVRAAECGLEFGGVTGHGYLVPYRNGRLSEAHGRDVYECQFIPGYQGFIELAYRSGRVSWIDAELVYERDQCDYGLGHQPFIVHKPFLGGNRGKVLFGYCVAYLNGAPVPKIEIMPLEEMEAIRKSSKSSRADSPWAKFPGEMFRKTVIRRARKWLPQTQEMEAAIAADNEDYDLSNAFAGNGGGGNQGVDGCLDRMRRAVQSKDVSPSRPKSERPPAGRQQDDDDPVIPDEPPPGYGDDPARDDMLSEIERLEAENE